MKRVLLIGLFACMICQLSAQTSIDTSKVVLDKSHLLNRFYIDSTYLKLNQLAEACGENEPAADMFGKAQESKFFGTLFCIIGGSLVLYPVVSCIWDDSPNVPMAVAGGCMAAISIPIFINHNRQSREAYKLMHEKYVPQKDDDNNASLNLGLTKHGIGLCLKF